MDVPDDVVDVAPVDDHLAQSGLLEAPVELVQARSGIEGDDFVPRHETVPGLERREVEGVLQDLQLIVQSGFLLLSVEALVEAPDEVVEVDGPEAVVRPGLLLAPEEQATEGEDDHGRWQQEGVDDDKGNGQEPQVRRAMEEALGQECCCDQDDHGGDGGLNGEGQQWGGRRFPSVHAEDPLAQQGPGLQAEDDQGEVVADQHRRDEALRPAQEEFDQASREAALFAVQFGLQAVRRHIGDFHP